MAYDPYPVLPAERNIGRGGDSLWIRNSPADVARVTKLQQEWKKRHSQTVIFKPGELSAPIIHTRGFDIDPNRTEQYLVQAIGRLDAPPVAPREINTGRGGDSNWFRPSAQDYQNYATKKKAWESRQMARESAQRFAWDLYKAHKHEFLGTAGDVEHKATTNFLKNLSRDVEQFRARYSDEDVTMLNAGAQVALDSLQQAAKWTTPAPKVKLFGFLPLKVDKSANSFIGVAAAAVTAGASAYLSAGTQAGSVAGTGSTLAETGAMSSTTVTSGAFTADLGIRGVQAANLASAGGYPGAALGMSTPTLVSTSGFAVAAPLAAVSPQALRLGVTGTTIQPSVMDTLAARVSTVFSNAKNAVLENPVQSAVAATGTAFTLKRVSESSNPLAALVNTVAGAIGLPPLIRPGGNGGNPGGVGIAPSSYFSTGGGGGGGGFGYGDSVQSKTWWIWPLLIGSIVFLVVKLRK